MKASESAQKMAEDWAYVLGDGGCYEGDAVADLAADFAQAEARGRIAGIRQAGTAARNALVAYEWPPQDGDAQIDHVLSAILALIPGEPA